MKIMNKIAIITGATGQDGSYLSELLLNQGYTVIGLRRRSSSEKGLERIHHLLNNNKILICRYIPLIVLRVRQIMKLNLAIMPFNIIYLFHA